MVKADAKRDYYADLELPSTADSEDIKKQFRLLAKQYHPDRNPGHEVTVVPKFQAVQAAHEILSDPVEKAKYDTARGKLAARSAANTFSSYADPYGFTRAANSKATTATQQFPFPPPPKTKDRRPPFATPNQKSQTSSGADKFNAFARGAPQSWDRARFDDARAEAGRGFPNMRPPPPPQGSAQKPPRTSRQAPTAPKPSPVGENPHIPNTPPPPFPGLSRTATARQQGYTSGAHGTDEQQAARSAYSYVRGSRGSIPQPHIYPPGGHGVQSPPVSRARPAVSPLRHARSSDYEMRHDHIGGSRPSSRYAGGGGERTDLHGDGIHRSASVRNSPVDPQWDDRGPFGRSTSHYDHLPRHRSASPGMRPTEVPAEFSSESSSSEEEELNMKPRPKAVPRSRPQPSTGPNFHAFAENDPALTGQFPSTNYTRVVNDSEYKFPPPEGREHTRMPFPDVPFTHAGASHGDDVGGVNGHGGQSDGPKYAPSPTVCYPWTRELRFGRAASRGLSFNGLPSWAVPSTVFPQTTPPRQLRQRKSDNLRSGSRFHPHCSHDIQANSNGSQGPVPPIPQTTFSAAEWHDKVTAEDIFRPADSQMRKSPSKASRTGAKPTSRNRGMSRGVDQDNASSSDNSSEKFADVPSDKAAAFTPGKLSEDFASKVKTSSSQGPARPAGTWAGHESDATDDSRDKYVVVEDAMDIDDGSPASGTRAPATNGVAASAGRARRTSKRQSTNGGVDLREFAQHAPFVPAATGLKGMDDLATHLPFESRPETSVEIGGNPAVILRALNLPKPPKPVVPPAVDRLDQANFIQYADHMSVYMREWNSFNAKMIEHFRNRQDRVCGTMSQNWISMLGDGPQADTLEENGTQKAGYAAYMQWLKDDAQCRAWWDHANEKHLQCMEDLGRTREAAKKRLRPI